MSKPSRYFNTLLITLLIPLVPFCLYYFFYFSSQKTYFTNRDFRLLTVLTRQIESKVDGTAGAYWKAAGAASAAYRGEKPEEFKVESFLEPIKKDGTNIRAVNAPERLSAFPKESNGKPSLTLDVKQEDGSYSVYFNYTGSYADRDKKLSPVAIHARSELDELIGPFVPNVANQKEFDDVLIAEENGAVIFEEGSVNPGLTNLDSLVNKDHKEIDFNLLKQNSNVLDVEIAQTDYKLFIQPVQLSYSKTASDDGQRIKWIVCGLVQSTHLVAESAAISYTILIDVIFFFIIVTLSIPLLKLLFMGSRERLRLADVYFLAFSAVMGSAVLTTFLIYSLSYTDLESKMDDQLKSLSSRIMKNFEAELGDANRQLAALNDNADLRKRVEILMRLDELNKAKKDDAKHDAADSEQVDKKERLLNETLDKLDGFNRNDATKADDQGWKNNYGCAFPKRCSGRTRALDDLLGENNEHPYLTTAVWIDGQGQQRIKWTTKSDLASFIAIPDRAYFKSILNGQTWAYEDPDRHESFRYFLEPVYSKTTGGQQVILSAPIRANVSNPMNAWVTALDIRPLSLLQSVLPTDLGYGYCVIDNEGGVLFHSDASRNLLENFFAESDKDGYLRSVVLANETKGLNLRYQGVDHRLFVRHIPNTPWSLVTFRDKQTLRTVTLELIAYSIFLFILYALLLLVLFTLYYLGNSQDTAGIVWPYLKRAPNYYLSIIVNLVLAVLFAVAIFVGNREIFLLASLLPILGFLLHHYNLKKGAKLGPHFEAVANFVERHTPLSYRSGYVLTLVTLLLLVSVLPMLAFFKLAYDREMSLFVGMGQINFARALEARRERIEAQYSSDDKNPDTAKQVRNLLQKRLNLNCDSESKSSPCDLYNEFFFGTQFIDKGLTNHSQPENKIERLLTALVPFNNSISLKVHGLKSGSLQREDSQENLVLHTNERVDESAANNTLEVKSVPTVLGGKGQHPMWWLGLALVLIILLPTGLFILINFIGKRIFLLNTDEPLVLYGEEFCHGCVSQNLLVLGSSFTRKDELLKRDDLEVIDLRKATKKGWTRLYNESQPEDKRRAIALDYFEYDWEAPATNQKKLRLLESFLLENKKIVVLSAVNLLDYRFDGSANGQDEQNGNHERSVRLFGSFLNVYLEDIGNLESFSKQMLEFETEWSRSKRTRKEQRHMTRLLRTLKRECQARTYLQKLGNDLLAQAGFERFTPESIVSHVKDKANAYYHAIWDTCSKDERVTLYTLAKYHVVSSRNGDLPRLLRRGLISREPYLRPMNESFTRFIVAETSPEKLVAWCRVEERNSWEMLRIPFIVILISAAAFLFFSQRELYNSTLAFVSALAATMPSLFKFIGLFSSAKTGNAG